MIELAHLTVARLEAEGRAAGFDARAGARRSRRRASTSAPRWCCCVADRTLRVCALYPDLMNIYADRGNLTVFERRCAWRGLGFELAGAGIGDEIDPDAHDLFYIGGGQDRDQALCARDLATVKRDALHAAAGRGAVDLRRLRRAAAARPRLRPGRRAAAGRRPRRSRHAPRGRPAAARQHRDRARPARAARRGSPASRTTPGGRTSARAPSRSGACSRATGTTGPTGPRASAAGRTGPSSGPTCTARCCRRTPRSPTGSPPPRSASTRRTLAPLDDALEAAAHAEAARAAGV